MSEINAESIRNEIVSIFKANSKSKTDTLDKIAELGKTLLGDLNTMDKTIYEISEEYEECAEKQREIDAQINQANAKADRSARSLSETNAKIAELEGKIANGEELSEAETKELNELYDSQKGFSESSDAANSKLSSLTSEAESVGSKLNGFDEQLSDILSKIDDYAEAGEVIKDSANEYGKKSMDCEKSMERNEKNWAKVFFQHAIFFDPITGLIGLGISEASGSNFDDYVDKAKLDEVSDQTFYDDINHEFIAEYDVIEAKGGNQISGARRKGTAKVFSYGKTISDASAIIKNKAEDVNKDS